MNKPSEIKIIYVYKFPEVFHCINTNLESHEFGQQHDVSHVDIHAMVTHRVDNLVDNGSSVRQASYCNPDK